MQIAKEQIQQFLLIIFPLREICDSSLVMCHSGACNKSKNEFMIEREYWFISFTDYSIQNITPYCENYDPN